MQHAVESWEIYTELWYEKFKERDDQGEVGVTE
jgi:hypothetical protein